jgi:ABC-2 type transport system permease protein
MIEKLKIQIQTFFHYSGLLHELVVRDIKVRYRRSFLGLLWTVLNPLLMMTVMTVVFSTFFKNNIANFPVYLLIGNIVFSLNSDSTSQALMSIVGNGGLIKKVYIPKYLFPLSKVMSCLVNFGFSFIALIIVMIVTRSQFHIAMLLSIVPLFYILLFSTGLSLILSSVTVYFRDVAHLYSVFILVWMYLTPIFYPFDILPHRIQTIINFNPMYQYIKYFRMLIMDGTLPGLRANIFCFGLGVITLIFGVFLFQKLQKKFILHI